MLLDIQALSYQVQAQTILDQVTLLLPEKGYLTISGPSGGGKSTLLKLCALLLTPSSGQILLAGKNQADYPVTLYRQAVSYCFQQPTLFGKTVLDNLQFPYTIRQKTFDAAFAQQQLQRVALPADYLTKAITELSGGERQRVALLRNTLFLPQVLLLDEVTAGLDETNKRIVRRFIQELVETGVAIMEVTHDTEELAQASQVIWIEKGRVTNGPADR